MFAKVYIIMTKEVVHQFTSDMSFANKVVIVTGGSSGIGAATAVHFAAEGAHVVIVGRNEANLNNVAGNISKQGKAPLIIKADLSNDDQVKTIVKKTIDKFGKLDVLVNNAGLLKAADLDDGNLMKIYDEVINTNLRSVVAITNLAIPHLVKTKGNIVNVSSIAGVSVLKSNGQSGFGSYCISKAGVNHFTKYAAMELASKGVRVNAVSPGPVETPMLDPFRLDPEWETMKQVTALKIITSPDEVGDLILYLASDKARSITGANYLIDAGVLVN